MNSEIKDYDEDYQGMTLMDNEYLLKIRKSDNMGFLAKLTKKLELPKAFDEWGNKDIKIIEEDFRAGWKVNITGDKYDRYRIGLSQQWCKLIHPLGFILEVHLDNFFVDILPHIENGNIKGEWKWIGNRISKK